MNGFKVLPANYEGVKVNSTGLFSTGDKGLVWNSEYEYGALFQMLFSIAWDVDYLVIDLPPGLSEIHKEIIKHYPKSRLVLVTTPSKLSYEDTIKGYAYFKKMGLNAGALVQNMSIRNNSCFTSDYPQKLIKNKKSIFLIPYSIEIMECNELGTPLVLKNKNFSKTFDKIVKSVLR